MGTVYLVGFCLAVDVGEYNNTFRNWEEKIVKEPKMDCQTRRLWYHGGQSRESFQEVSQ